MPEYVHDTAPTQFVEANGIRFAYRRFGKPAGVPLVFNQHFRGTMDYWDPAVTDGLAKGREVILFNNAGVSNSSGSGLAESASDRGSKLRGQGGRHEQDHAGREQGARPSRIRCAVQPARLRCGRALLVGGVYPAQRTYRTGARGPVQSRPQPAGHPALRARTDPAESDFVSVHGRFSGNGRPAAYIAADILRIEDGRLAEHWDVLQDEAARTESKSGRPMFGDAFPS